MKLSTKSRYSVRLMVDLALREPGHPVFLKDVARNQDLSEKYMSRLVIPLRGAGLVISARGAHGGYMLARDPKEITLLEIIEVSEGKITLVDCIANPETCNTVETCPTRGIWGRLENHITTYLKGITLADIAEEYRQGKGSLMYHI